MSENRLLCGLCVLRFSIFRNGYPSSFVFFFFFLCFVVLILVGTFLYSSLFLVFPISKIEYFGSAKYYRMKNVDVNLCGCQAFDGSWKRKKYF